jgi:hypothetical protein
MAIIRTSKYSSGAPALTEDPTIGANKLYFQNDAFDATNLNCLFDTTIIWSTDGGYSTFGTSSPSYSYTGGVLQLKGEVTYVRQITYNTTDVYNNNLDYAPFASMDPARPIIQTRSDANSTGSQTQTFMSFVYEPNSTYTKTSYFVRKLGGNDWSATVPAQYANVSTDWIIYPLYINPNTNNMICYTAYHRDYHPGIGFSSFTGAFSSTATWQAVGYAQGNTTNQFVGVSADGFAIFMTNIVNNDYTQTFYKYNDTTNTTTTLATFNSAPSAGGNSAGGARSSPTGGVWCPKFASRTFNNPNTGLTSFYMPYMDSNGIYHPFLFGWDKTSNTFTRESAITVNYAGSYAQGTYWTADASTASAVTVPYGMQHVYYNESFVLTGTRYLTFMQLHGAGGVYDSDPKKRTFITYTVNGSNYANLTYHSSFAVPLTPKNIVWLNDARTLMGVFTQTYFYVYAFNGSTGWTLTASFNFGFISAGRDSLGRIWAVDYGPRGGGRVHLLSGPLPSTVVATPAYATYTYAGTNINTTFSVSAYNISGARVAADVVLTATGSGLRFVNGSSQQVTTLTVTTSTSGAVSVNAVIVGAGPITVTTSIAF